MEGARVGISDGEWDQAIDEVSKEINVSPVAEEELNRNSQMLRRGCEKMGYKAHSPNKRNCVNCMQCGLCHLGCHYETKQDMRVTYIHRVLHEPGSDIRIYVNCSAERLTHSNGEVDGVEGNFLDRAGNPVYKIRVNAKLVIVSAGAIASSHLLLKNSIAEAVAGRGLALHPAPFVIGDFPFEVRANQGIPMAYTLHEFGVTNGVKDGGFLVEGIYLPPLQFAMLMPERGGERYELMKRYDHFTMAGVLVRDDQNGVISMTDAGFARVSYQLGTKELDAISKGAEIIARMWFSLGATRVITSHLNKRILAGPDEIPGLSEAIKSDPKNLLLGSAHPQGGNRMGVDRAKCVVDSDCRVYGFRNLFVCDASVFPTAVGVNPQLTVMSLATIAADRMVKNWNAVSVPAKEQLGEVCSIRQPMYCSTVWLDNMYEVSDTQMPNEALVNSDKDEIVDGENWTFDMDTLTIWNNRYWKGFFSTDHGLVNSVILYTGGFWKKFRREGTSIMGRTHPYESNIYAANEAINAEYPGFGKLIHLRYLEPPFDRFYDLLKIVDKDTILGKAFAVRDPPRGEHILTFSMSRKYRADFMTHDDFRMIFSKARKLEVSEVLGVWEGRLLSDSAPSDVLFRFRYLMENGALKCRYLFGGFLPGTSDVKFERETMDMLDFTGGLFHDEIRMVRRDFMVGKYSTMGSTLFGALNRAPSFLMRDGERLSLPYAIRRV